MSEINDGGSAFPTLYYEYNHYQERHVYGQTNGVSMRDWFAAKAMQGSFTSPISSSDEEKDYIAMHAYKMADAMIRARGES